MVVEDTLLDSQCEFKLGQVCIDMIFCVGQIIEEAMEHKTKVVKLFVGLRKAYDSMPRQALVGVGEVWHPTYACEVDPVSP